MLEFNDNSMVRSVSADFYIDEKDRICGRPWFHLCNWKNSMDIGLAIHDNDDLDIGVIYKCKTEEEKEKIFHDLINYLYDIDGKCVTGDNIFDETLFPNYSGVNRVWW